MSSFASRLAPHPPKPPVASSSKAGRNLKAAIPVAVSLLALVAASVVWRVEVFVALVAVALCFALWEAAGAFLNRGIRLALVPSWATTIASVAVVWHFGLTWGFFSWCCGALVTFAWGILISNTSPAASVRDAVASVFSLAWIVGLGIFAVALASLPSASWMVALLVLMPAASDTGGWMFGVMWGKHPMSPSISPKKSWEGFAGSLVWAIVVAFLLGKLALNFSVLTCLMIGIAAVVCSTIGDLSESLLKRDLGVKDMGSIFPGHGGVLDRIDSILMWAPACYLIVVCALSF